MQKQQLSTKTSTATKTKTQKKNKKLSVQDLYNESIHFLSSVYYIAVFPLKCAYKTDRFTKADIYGFTH